MITLIELRAAVACTLVTMALVALSGCAKGGRSEASSGAEVPCNVTTAGPDTWLHRHLNSAFRSCHSYIRRDNGELTLKLDYHQPEEIPGGTWLSEPIRVLVRTFDANGEYLSHFETKEAFIYVGKYDRFASGPRFKLFPFPIHKFTDGDNTLAYRINVRDASFVGATEFGWAIHMTGR